MMLATFCAENGYDGLEELEDRFHEWFADLMKQNNGIGPRIIRTHFTGDGEGWVALAVFWDFK